MKVLFIHNYYRQRGGEDLSFESDVELLRNQGHEVQTFERHNDDIVDRKRFTLALDTVWNRDTEKAVKQLIERFRPDVMHCNNLFPQISSSIYRAARQGAVPVVQALRNYRMFCANSFFFREDKVCTDCLGQTVPLAAIRHKCYRDSRSASSVVVGMQMIHRILGTHRKRVDVFFTPSEFARKIFLDAGFDSNRILVKPNFISPDPGVGKGEGGFMVFVGRLSPEKGLQLVLDAWETGRIPLPLHVIGDGPLRQRVLDSRANIRWLGALPHADVLRHIGDATGLVMASNWYETFGRTIAEGFSRGTPAIVSDLGAMAELVQDGVNGYRFQPGSTDSLIEKVHLLIADEPRRQCLRKAARESYVKYFAANASYEALMRIYNLAILRGTKTN